MGDAWLDQRYLAGEGRRAWWRDIRADSALERLELTFGCMERVTDGIQNVGVGDALVGARRRTRHSGIASVARNRSGGLHLEEVSRAVVVVELLDRDATAGEPPEPVFQLVHVLAQFGLDRRGWL